MANTRVLSHIHRLRDDDRGFSLILIGFSFMAFLAATTLAIDVGMFMNARSQAQNSADAGAHAGATALAFNSFTDHSAGGPAVTSTINTAKMNLVVGQAVSVLPADVTFPLDADTNAFDLVQVKVYRTTARGNPLDTLMGRIFGINTVNIAASATAIAAPANAETCVMPLTIPDKWIENQTGPWDPLDTFDIKDNKGNPIANPDVYVAPGTKGATATGYTVEVDKGLQLVLKGNNTSKAAPSMYDPWDLPGSVGGSDYRDNIADCNSSLVKIGDTMTPENGNMVGPTKQGVDDLVAKDPNAKWDTTCKCVVGSNPKFAMSPRIRAVPLYNPVVYADGKASGKANPQLEVVNYLGFFIESVTGAGEVTGRITPIGGKMVGNGGPATGAFPRAIMLVQ
jgi:hypothetical protein